MNQNEEYCFLIQNYLKNYEKMSEENKDRLHSSVNKSSSISIISSSTSINSVTSIPPHEKDAVLETADQLIKPELIQQGNISGHAYRYYLQSAGGYGSGILTVLVFILPVICSVFSNWWLADWIELMNSNISFASSFLNSSLPINQTTSSNLNTLSQDPDLQFNALIYGLSAVFIVVFMILRGFVFMKVTLRASSSLHRKMLTSVLRGTMNFFETTPAGRIINNFSKDLDEVDCKLPFRGESCLQNNLLVLSSLMIVAIVFPWFLFVLIPLVVLFVIIFMIFRAGLRQLKRQENVTKAPVLGHILTTLTGLHVLHAFKKEQQFFDKFRILLDSNSLLLYLFSLSIRWVALRFSLLSILATTVTAAFVVGLKGSVPAAFAGLALVYANQFTVLLQFAARITCEAEATFVSVERIQKSIDNPDREVAPKTKKPASITSKLSLTHPGSANRSLTNHGSENHKTASQNSLLSKHWPSNGSLTFHNYSMRYREDLPLVLKNISLEIRSGEKIGIVGRTGSGKTSLATSLFRFCEPETGSIEIDNVDITKLELQEVRNAVSMIPQDSLLFTTTIRFNLDPLGKYTDKELWSILEKCYIKEKVKQLPNALDTQITAQGSIFSSGERQLLCISRALLKDSKIVVVDEATASVDSATDHLVQTSLREAFHNCTVLTIAHRIDTILDSDRIIVLKDGRIKEFGSPKTLRKDKRSLFHNILSTCQDGNVDLVD